MAWYFPLVLLVLAAFAMSTLGCRTTDSEAELKPAVAMDSIVVDLFSLGARMRMLRDNAHLTPYGKTFYSDSQTQIENANVFLPTDKPVRIFSAYARHEHDILCDPKTTAKDTLLIQLDDGIEIPCHDTDHVWVPSYPYQQSLSVSFLDGRGFWILASDVPFARGSLIIHFDYLTGVRFEPN